VIRVKRRKLSREMLKVLQDEEDRARKKKKITFAAYRSVRAVLREMFNGKCSYCEHLYEGGYSGDVEHYRPKNGVDLGKRPFLQPCYRWLASRWDNLLISCGDCNQLRSDFMVDPNNPENSDLDKKVQFGKKNRFPLLPGSKYGRRPGRERLERPVLINPCTEDPARFFAFNAYGTILPRGKSGTQTHLRAQGTIDLLGLKRIGLVRERRERLKEIWKDMGTVLRRAVRLNQAKGNLKPFLEDFDADLDGLKSSLEPEKTYLQLSRQHINPFLQLCRVFRQQVARRSGKPKDRIQPLNDYVAEINRHSIKMLGVLKLFPTES
jgi:uncharacterized protein (TIGR02646 family)